MSHEIERVEPTGIVRQPDDLSVEEMVSRVQKIQQVMKALMKEGTHYGTIPGTPKPSLWQPGAQILSVMFQLDPQYAIERVFDGGHLDVLSICTLFHAPSGLRRASGAGSCSTRESKYAYRGEGRSCPECGAGAIRKSKYKPGFYCHAKVGGCGFEFAPDDERISKQEVGRVANPDLADVYNTVLKMANKRAFVAAVLAGTGASDIFTQDLEEDDEVEARPHAPRGAAKPEPAVDPLVAARAQTIHQLFAKKFGKHDRDAVLATIARDLGRAVSSSKDLTKADFETLCEKWNRLGDGAGQVPATTTAAPSPSPAPHEAPAPAEAGGGGAAADNGLPFPGLLGDRIEAAAARAGRTSDEYPGKVQVDLAIASALKTMGGWRDPFDLVKSGIGEEVLDYYTKLAESAEGVTS